MSRFLPWFIAVICIASTAAAWSTSSIVGAQNVALHDRVDTLSSDLFDARLKITRMQHDEWCRQDPVACLDGEHGI